MLAVAIAVFALRLYNRRFCVARIDLGLQRTLWEKDQDSCWTSRRVPAYTLVALDLFSECVHKVAVEARTHRVFASKWTEPADIRYKREVFKAVKAWAAANQRESLACDLDTFDDLLAWEPEL